MSDIFTLLVIACAAATWLSIRRWYRRMSAQYGHLLPAPAPRRVRAPLWLRRIIAQAREGWYRLPRTTFIPPADGKPLDDCELYAYTDLTLTWESGLTRPDPVMPPRHLEDS